MAQHLDALKQANETKYARAQIKRDLKSGKTTIQELLEDIPDCIRSAKLYDIIRAQHRWGKDRTNYLLRRLGLSEWLTFENMTERQRVLLKKEFDSKT